MKNPCRMMIVAGLVVALFAACSKTIVVKRGETLALNTRAIAVTPGGKKLTLVRVRIKGDTISAREYYTRKDFRVPRSSVEKLIVESRAVGALQGALFGTALFGGSYVAATALANSGGGEENVYGIAILGVAGLLYGPVVGAIQGVRYDYVLEKEPDTMASAPMSIPDTLISKDGLAFPDSGDAAQKQSVATETTPLAASSPLLANYKREADSLIRWHYRARDSVRSNPTRDRWYMGGELGAGFGSVPSGPGSDASYQGGDGGLHLSGSVGLTLNPYWLAGLRYSYARLEHRYEMAGEDVFKNSVTHNLLLETFYFPQRTGFFIKGALGYGGYDYSATWDGPSLHSSGGVVGSAGLGYALWRGRSFNWTFGADVVGARYFDGAGSFAFRPTVGVYWY